MHHIGMPFQCKNPQRTGITTMLPPPVSSSNFPQTNAFPDIVQKQFRTSLSDTTEKNWSKFFTDDLSRKLESYKSSLPENILSRPEHSTVHSHDLNACLLQGSVSNFGQAKPLAHSHLSCFCSCFNISVDLSFAWKYCVINRYNT